MQRIVLVVDSGLVPAAGEDQFGRTAANNRLVFLGLSVGEAGAMAVAYVPVQLGQIALVEQVRVAATDRADVGQTVSRRRVAHLLHLCGRQPGDRRRRARVGRAVRTSGSDLRAFFVRCKEKLVESSWCSPKYADRRAWWTRLGNVL